LEIRMDISGQTPTPKPPPASIIPFLNLAKKRSEERMKATGKYRPSTMTVDGIEYVFYLEEDGRTNFRPARKEDEWVAIGGGGEGARPIKRRYSGGLEIPADISGFGEYYDTNARDRSGNGGGADKTSE
jgi:hypothetical protein